MARIGLNGFGRLGRQVLKVAINKCKQKCAEEISRILMINDPNLTTESMAYLLRNDSHYGKFNSEVVDMGSSLMVDGQKIEVTNEQKLDKIPWKNCKVEYVIDTTGQNTNCTKATVLGNDGVKRVITSGCSNVPIFTVGVNHACFELNMKAVSAGTPSLNCVMPLVRVLHDQFQIKEAMVTVLKPLSINEKIYDDAHRTTDRRSSRSSIHSFAPCMSSVTQKIMSRLMPELQDRIELTAIKIPVPCVGAVEITAKLGKETTYEVLKKQFNEASKGYMKGMIRYTEEELVSTDIIGDPHSCVFDAKAGGGVSNSFVKIFAWYDSESGYANRVYDLANYIASRETCSK
ncbi:hypothetical protein JTB14_010508 [Gonioctena quinquepunctata]|nr:hypothetical protein JTB14_010508 [Gonioctena quinquepunctata]